MNLPITARTWFPLVVSLLSWACIVRGDENLLRNSGFEATDTAGKPVGWTIWSGPDAVTLTNLSFKGSKAVMARIQSRVNWRVKQEIHLPRPGEYELSFNAKTTGDAWVNAVWEFEDKTGKKIKPGHSYTQRLSHASNWTREKAKIKAPEGVTKLILRFRFGQTRNGGKGVAFLDDVTLKASDNNGAAGATPPEGARLVLDEDFSSDQLPPEWKVLSGEWSVKDGALSGGKNGTIFYTGKIGSPNMRLEYTAWVDGEPGDLSAWLSQDVTSKTGNGYFFGFGCRLNTENKILRGGKKKVLTKQGGPLEVFENGIRSGVKHKIVAQRNYNELKFFVDGKLILEGNDPFFGNMTGEGFGFFIWGGGCIDDVKVYALPWEGGGAAGECEVKFQTHEGFEEFSLGASDGKFKMDAGNPVLRIIDRPTWVYKKPMGNEFRKDYCLEINETSSDEDIKISRSFEPLESGIVEFDLLAEDYGELKFSVIDAEGKNILNLIISEDGRFITETEKGRKVIRDTIRYQRRAFDAEFRFMTNRWYTFRLQFSEGLRQIVLLDHYSELQYKFALGMAGEYLPLYCAINSKKEGKAASFAVEGTGKTHLFLDNLIIFGPIGTDTVRGKPLTLPASKLLDLDYPPRKDPFQLKLQTFRHLWAKTFRFTPLWRAGDKAPKYTFFRAAGDVYNQALVNLSFIEQKINMLQRGALYVKDTEREKALSAKLAELDQLYQKAERLQEKALRAYAEAHLSDQDEKKLSAFYNAMEKVKSAQSAINARVKEALDMLTPDAATTDVIPCPTPTPTDETTWNAERERWERGGEPVIYHYFSHGAVPKQFLNDMKLLGFPKPNSQAYGYTSFPIPANASSELEEGKYIGNKDARNIKWLKRLVENKSSGLMKIRTGYNYACMFAPKWWLDKYKDNDDIFFRQPNGSKSKTPPWHGLYFLNYWNPEVRKLIDEQFEAIGELGNKYENVIDLFQCGGEIKNRMPGGMPGYNESAINEFREILIKKYGSIDNLNTLWGSDYDDFEAIVPPPARVTPPSGLQYEFRKFTHDGFNNWLKRERDALARSAPNIPVAVDTQYTLGGRVLFEALDLVGFCDSVDIKLYHTYQAWDRKLVDRWHHQVASAMGTSWGTMEWMISQGTPYMFQLDKIRNSGLREKTMQIIWGITTQEQWHAAGYGNWQYSMNIQNPALDRMIFNYVAPYYAIYMDRARRLGEPALTMPTAKPEIGLLETTSSYYNGLDVRGGMRSIAIALTDSGWNFEFLYERLLQDGRQNLRGTDVLFAPDGICMTDELAKTVYEWVQAGGVLLCVGGPAGTLNEYGRPIDRLDDVFKGKWLKTGEKWELDGVEPFRVVDGTKAWRTDYGAGQVIVFDKFHPSILDMLPSLTEKRFGCDNPAFQFCMREKDGVNYLYALNWSIDKTEDAEIFVKGSYGSIIDEGLQLPMKVPHYEKDGRTYFRTKLAPAGMTLFRIE